MLLGALVACRAEPRPAQIIEVRLATGYPAAGAYYGLGNALARLYNETLPNVRVVVESTPGSAYNLNALQQGAADLGFTLSDIAYRAYAERTQRDMASAPRLRGVAVVFQSVVHLVVRRDSKLRTLADLRHATVGYGSPGAELPRTVTYTDVLKASGAVTDVTSVRVGFDAMPQMLTAGEVDVWMIMSGLPLAPVSMLARSVGIRLLEIGPDAAARIRTQYPFYKRAIIPAGMYEGQQEPVRTVSVDNLLVCRDDLDEELVYQLTRTFFENLTRLAADHEVAMQVDPDLASASPIPLHPGAARYYRERELLK